MATHTELKRAKKSLTLLTEMIDNLINQLAEQDKKENEPSAVEIRRMHCAVAIDMIERALY